MVKLDITVTKKDFRETWYIYLYHRVTTSDVICLDGLP